MNRNKLQIVTLTAVLSSALVFSGCPSPNNAALNNGAPPVNTDAGNTNAAVVEATPDAGAKQTEVTAEAVIKEVYQIHGEDFKKNANRILGGKTRTYLDKFFDKPLADLIWKDRTTNVGEIGVLDFDPIYNAQDADIKNLVVNPAKVEGEKASVTVTFQNYDRKDTLVYQMVKRAAAWKIADIKYSDGTTLNGIFREAAKTDAAPQADSTGENFFSGTYRVGPTTATVKPVKMAFEVRWAKGSGAMMFFFEGDESAGRYIYASEDSPRGQDRFVFDDETFTTGTFIRADGTEMPVKKVN